MRTRVVVNDRMLDKIGPAANSARSLFLYGPPGNGKTTIAHALWGLLGGDVEIPHALAEVLPLLTVLPLQLLAYFMADLKGTDVDQPRNLAKTVTVE